MCFFFTAAMRPTLASNLKWFVKFLPRQLLTIESRVRDVFKSAPKSYSGVGRIRFRGNEEMDSVLPWLPGTSLSPYRPLHISKKKDLAQAGVVYMCLHLLVQRNKIDQRQTVAWKRKRWGETMCEQYAYAAYARWEDDKPSHSERPPRPPACVPHFALKVRDIWRCIPMLFQCMWILQDSACFGDPGEVFIVNPLHVFQRRGSAASAPGASRHRNVNLTCNVIQWVA